MNEGISRGQIWIVNFNPTIGDEIQKTRPAVVMSMDASFRHRLRIVVPITGWQAKFSTDFWMIPISPSTTNNLDKESAANAFQVKSVSEQRFIRKVGTVTSEQLDAIATAIALCIGFR